jgi:hypothetical protein
VDTKESPIPLTCQVEDEKWDGRRLDILDGRHFIASKDQGLQYRVIRLSTMVDGHQDANLLARPASWRYIWRLIKFFARIHDSPTTSRWSTTQENRENQTPSIVVAQRRFWRVLIYSYCFQEKDEKTRECTYTQRANVDFKLNSNSITSISALPRRAVMEIVPTTFFCFNYSFRHGLYFVKCCSTILHYLET